MSQKIYVGSLIEPLIYPENLGLHPAPHLVKHCLFLKQAKMYYFSTVHKDSVADLLEFVKTGLNLSENIYRLLEIYCGTSRHEVKPIGYVDFIRHISWRIFH